MDDHVATTQEVVVTMCLAVRLGIYGWLSWAGTLFAKQPQPNQPQLGVVIVSTRWQQGAKSYFSI